MEIRTRVSSAALVGEVRRREAVVVGREALDYVLNGFLFVALSTCSTPSIPVSCR